MTHAAGAGWRVDFRNPEHTVHFLDYEDDDGIRFSVRFDPREDGPSVYLSIESVGLADGALATGRELDRILDRLAIALDGFFPHDTWNLWTATWPRYPLRWKGPHDHLVEHWPPSRVQYGEPGRAIDLVCAQIGTDGTGRPLVRISLPAELRWDYPPGGAALDAAERARVVDRLRASKTVTIDVAAIDASGDA